MIIQCDSGHVNGDLIACARNRIYDLKAKADDCQITHVLFVIHLPHHVVSSSFVGFQGDPWVSSHVDDLRPTADNAVMPHDVIGSTISELFLGTPDSSSFLLSSERRNVQQHVASKDPSGLVASVSSTESMDVSVPNGETVVSEDMPSEDEERDSAKADVRWAEGTQHQEDEEMETEEVILVQAVDSVVDNMEIEQLPSGDDQSKTNSEASKTIAELDASVSHQNTFTAGNGSHQNGKVNSTAVSCMGSPLYKRLHNCIYAAASKLKDFTTKRSTKRVEILVRLIPQETIGLSGKSCNIVSCFFVPFLAWKTSLPSYMISTIVILQFLPCNTVDN